MNSFMCIIFVSLFILVTKADAQSETSIYIKMEYVFGETYEIYLNNTVEYIFQRSVTENYLNEYPARVTAYSEKADLSNPVIVTARTQKEVRSWRLPLKSGILAMKNVSHTLCPISNIFAENTIELSGATDYYPIVHLYTSSLQNVLVNLKVDIVTDFTLYFNVPRNVVVGPSKPVIYFYSFTKGITELDNQEGNVLESHENYFRRQKKYLEYLTELVTHNSVLDETKTTVLVHITAEDDTCMMVSIQNASCPFFDTERELSYEGLYATVSRQGGISVTKRKYPDGFYIVLVVKSDDKDCTGQGLIRNKNNFNNDFFDWKSQEFDQLNEYKVTNRMTRDKYINITILRSVSYREYILGVIVLLLVIVGIYLIVLIAHAVHNWKSTLFATETTDGDEGQEETRNSTVSPMGQSVLDIAENNYGMRARDVDSIDGNLEPLEQLYLNELCKRDPKALQKQSNMFSWHLLTVSIFYGLPVVQLVIQYQKVLNVSGNQDLCYYNFLCAHPFGFFSDFNHIYSNLGYILLGLLFIAIVWRRKKIHMNSAYTGNFGIPQHYGLYYAMGGALIMEGVLSGSYHICPNHSNFQFDTSFMYVMAVLCMIKIYQSRHPDINARAHVTFGVLAWTVFICLIGVLFPNIYFWIFFTIIHVSVCMVLSLQVYYMGRLRLELLCCKQCVTGGICRPAFRSRCVMVVIGNLCNWSLAGFGLYLHSKDFASHLLYLFLMNLALYMFWYLIMKLIHKERPLWYCWVLFFMASLTWGGALRFFFDGSTSWSLTPAQSRAYNKHCVILNFYDNHDIWHILSAAAMFFSFMLFLTMDDDIIHVPRYKIPVF